MASDGDAFETITVTVEAGVAEITLNRPDKLNSFNTMMHRELRAALKQIAGDDTVRAVTLTGAGRGFCAGQDLSDRVMSGADDAPDLGETLDAHYNPLVRSLRAMEKPVIAAVNGVAAGAGCNIALACDLVLAGESASFIQAFCKIGLIPDSGGTWTLPRLVGWQRALGMAMLGDKISSEQAEEWGLIWKRLPDAELMPEARKLAAHLATQPTKGLALIKQAMNASMTNDFADQLDLERDLQRVAGRTADYREGVQAFIEKRAARFTGA
ncbi:MAG: 2-(1,2-epoxy-1,2-dihydrophenyl)acetyl-CoA isomerase PaaG [Alphaproteobacteria bacterium]|nr:2-(1,2-epoxy-1,2-dihydrophenyl)acetyl-CoA isomerase PaaG [Alphaproteobacteria bacterium]